MSDDLIQRAIIEALNTDMEPAELLADIQTAFERVAQYRRDDDEDNAAEEACVLEHIATVLNRIARLEALRVALRAESISYGELAELQSLAPWIEPGDVELLEPAGVPEAEAHIPANQRSTPA